MIEITDIEKTGSITMYSIVFDRDNKEYEAVVEITTEENSGSTTSKIINFIQDGRELKPTELTEKERNYIINSVKRINR